MARFALSQVVAAAVVAVLSTQASAVPITSDLQIHLDASAITGLSNGDPVDTWADQSGNNRDATAAGAQRPTYISSALSGKPGVRFDGSNTMSSTFSEFAIDGTTMFAVFRVTSSTQGTLLSLNGTSGTSGGGNQAFMYVSRFAAGDLFASFDGSSGDDSGSDNLDGPYNDGAPHLFMARSDAGSSGTNNILERGDGVEQKIYGDAAQQNPVNKYTVGSLENGTSSPLTGDIAEVLVYSRPLTNTEIADTEAFLLQKYSIPEPSSAALLCLGGIGLIARRRRVACGAD